MYLQLYLLKDQCKGVLVKRLRPGQAMYVTPIERLPDSLFFNVLHAGDRLVSIASQLIDNETSNLHGNKVMSRWWEVL